jgi:hypothetical protein
MEISVARKRLEEMRGDLDRTVSVLLGEHHQRRGGGADPGDAGANLTEADRNAASVQAATLAAARAVSYRLTQLVIRWVPTESSERACSSVSTSSPKLDGSRASR